MLEGFPEIMDPARIPAAVVSVLLCAVVGIITGPAANQPQPLLWILIDKLLGPVGDRLNNPARARGDLIMRGFFVSLLGIAFSILIIFIFQYTTVFLLFSAFIEVVALSCLVTAGSLWFCTRRLYSALGDNAPLKPGAYLALVRGARRNLVASDSFSITRTGIGVLTQGFDRGLVAPVFWYVLSGLPAAVLYAVVTALAWRFGREGEARAFGRVPLTLAHFMGFLPSFLAAAFITLGALFTPGAKAHRALRMLSILKRSAPYHQGGRPLSALAWAFDISLGGPAQSLSGDKIKAAWIGPEGASAQVGRVYLHRSLYLIVVACAVFLASLCGLYLWYDALG